MQAPGFGEDNPALEEAARQVLNHLGLVGSEFDDLISLEQLLQAATLKAAAMPGQKPWDYAYGAACEILYEACRNPASEGYAAAFGWLRRYFYEWFRSQVNGDEEAAEDLAAETLVSIVRRLDQVRFPTAFLAWTQQIARNHLKEYFSKKERSNPTPATNPAQSLEAVRVFLNFTEGEIEDTSPGSNPEKMVLDRELRSDLLESIKQMRSTTKNSELYRRIIVGFYFESLSIEELATFLKLTPVQVTKLKSQALKNLRKIWQKLDQSMDQDHSRGQPKD